MIMNILIILVFGSWLFWLLAPVMCGDKTRAKRVEPHLDDGVNFDE